MNWDTPAKPAELAESRLIEAILAGQFPIGSTLPAERELATQLGVTRPTLRETLQRLARDGWVDINHGKPTRVQNYWEEGSLGVLAVLSRYPQYAPANFVAHLLVVRQLLAPTYTELAVAQANDSLLFFVHSLSRLPETPQAYAEADWHLHHQLTIASGNPIFTLILNGFAALYQTAGPLYFAEAAHRTHSQAYYQALAQMIEAKDAAAAANLTQRIMQQSINLWQTVIRQ
ncbi:MAG: fatty acid metabolism transcriptional regulator FadR [Chloroflexi bacterium]|nr:fatty acid metabolism transcriptional regulator FadR [Chloroflexota bacterium]MBP8054289.1 fatty acid metabolism transcriptional regulator FadR [Chloroflexota bacterium]